MYSLRYVTQFRVTFSPRSYFFRAVNLMHGSKVFFANMKILICDGRLVTFVVEILIIWLFFYGKTSTELLWNSLAARKFYCKWPLTILSYNWRFAILNETQQANGNRKIFLAHIFISNVDKNCSKVSNLFCFFFILFFYYYLFISLFSLLFISFLGLFRYDLEVLDQGTLQHLDAK